MTNKTNTDPGRAAQRALAAKRKAEAKRLDAKGRPAAHIAQYLGVHVNTVYKYLREP